MVGTEAILQGRITIVLLAVIFASYALSIVLTSVNAQSAYFSLLTRSWELALGGLIAVHGAFFRRIPQVWAAVASWVGLAVILVASVTLTGSSVYPGALVAIPTFGAGLVIAAGAAEPKWGVERLLRRQPFPFLAAISFSLYLWHWPILEIAAQSRGVTSLPAWDNVLLLLAAGVLATLTYYFFENPFRHSRYLARRRWASLLMGLCLIAATLAVTTYEESRPTIDLGILATVASGSICPSPSPSVVSHLRSSYAPAQAPGARGIQGARSDRGHGWRFDGLHASSGTPSSRAVVWNAIREWCCHRMWDRKRPDRALLRAGKISLRIPPNVRAKQTALKPRPSSAIVPSSSSGEARRRQNR